MVKTNVTDDRMLEIIFKDNGTGIPENLVSKIFDPMFTTKPSSEETCLGLYAVKDIVKSHKELWR